MRSSYPSQLQDSVIISSAPEKETNETIPVMGQKTPKNDTPEKLVKEEPQALITNRAKLAYDEARKFE